MESSPPTNPFKSISTFTRSLELRPVSWNSAADQLDVLLAKISEIKYLKSNKSLINSAKALFKDNWAIFCIEALISEKKTWLLYKTREDIQTLLLKLQKMFSPPIPEVEMALESLNREPEELLKMVTSSLNGILKEFPSEFDQYNELHEFLGIPAPNILKDVPLDSQWVFHIPIAFNVKYGGVYYFLGSLKSYTSGVFSLSSNFVEIFSPMKKGKVASLEKTHSLTHSNETEVFFYSLPLGYLRMDIKHSNYFVHLKMSQVQEMGKVFLYIVDCLSKCYLKSGMRYLSFAPVRKDNLCKMYADGEEYFSDLADDLEKANSTIHITDWWLCPLLYLKRPIELIKEGIPINTHRLDMILKRASKRGVKIFIILWGEPKMASDGFYQSSEFVKNYLQTKTDPNIQIRTHSCWVQVANMNFPIFWSHHQKIVIVDGKTAFLGGIDLCYGRWDNSEHRLTDAGLFFPSIDYSNPRIKDLTKPEVTSLELEAEALDRVFQHRMPWHDIQIKLQGPSVFDLVSHFQLQWKYAANSEVEIISSREEGNLTQESRKTQIREYMKSVIPKQKEKVDFATRLLSGSVKANKESMKENIACNLFREHLLGRLASSREKVNDIIVQGSDLGESSSEMEESKLESPIRSGSVSLAKLKETGGICGMVKCQVLRSASSWSLGLKYKETSIYAAYIDFIANAKHYVYMENQFFISETCELNGVKNEVSKMIIERIVKAHQNSEDFKFFLVMPLSPGTPGEPWKVNSLTDVTRIQTALENGTIRSIYSILKEKEINGENYFVVLGLRTHDVLPSDEPVTEQIYVHSKLMIVDDYKMIVGSANINDRSLLGDRDSEIAVAIEEDQFSSAYDTIVEEENPFNSLLSEIEMGWKRNKASTVSSKPNLGGGAIQKFRMKLFNEHFDRDAKNITSLLFWESLKAQAKENTEVYRGIFPFCFPDDKIQTEEDRDNLIKRKSLKVNKATYNTMKTRIKGHVVEYPRKFLKDIPNLHYDSFGRLLIPLLYN